jgi:ATP-dependent Clp protease ATP-binding subunit ClpC
LLDELRRIEVAVAGEAVGGRKRDALGSMSQPGFWDDRGRFEVLAQIEYLDRLEAAFRTAQNLGIRLRDQASRNGHGSVNLVSLLATRLYVLEQALSGLGDGDPFDVFLRLRPVGGADAAERGEFVRTLCEMYVAWGEQRGMRIERVEAGDPDERLLSVSGLGASTILAPDVGLHVLELVGEEDRGGDRSVDRVVVAVELAPWSPGPDDVPVAMLGREAFSGTPTPTHVVRRYRAGPAPLVRDAVRGYRTGRLDRVLRGDFDLF